MDNAPQQLPDRLPSRHEHRVPVAWTGCLLLAAALPAQQLITLGGPWLERGNVARDQRRDRIVAFGADGQTWELDGNRWLLRSLVQTGSGPVPRRRPAMVFDPDRGNVVLFGGADTILGAGLGDTWTYDGSEWRAVPQIFAPPRRESAAITFDTVRRRVLMFGGRDLGQWRNDTWEFDGVTWTQRTPTNVPSAAEPSMDFDTRRGRAVLTTDDVLRTFTQLWEWDGSNWIGVPAVQPWPFSRVGTTVAFDPGRRRTVVVGGGDGFGPAPVWEWDGIAWSNPGTSQDWNRLDMAAWFEPARGGIVVGGGTQQIGLPRFDRSLWNGVIATPIEALTPPAPLLTSRAAWWDDGRREFVVFGAGLAASATTDTCIWDGRAWRLATPLQRPTARAETAATFDSARSRGLVFGGVLAGTATMLDELWSFDGAQWLSVVPAGARPSARRGAAMAFDRARGVAVLFGGRAVGPVIADDTWEWNGTAWQLATPASTRPPARYNHRMAYDAARARVVLHGGQFTTADLADTWEWDGIGWTRSVSVTAPGTFAYWLGYDDARQRLVVARANNTTQTWFDFDGVAWTPMVTPPGAPAAAEAFDPLRQRHLLLRDGRIAEWATAPGEVRRLGSACGNPAPLLAARTHPRIGEAEFGLEVVTAPASFVLFALADAQVTTPIGGGCTVELGRLLATSLRLADARGLAVAPIPLPLQPSLRGLAMFAQAGVLSPAGALTVTSALSLRVGD